MNATSIEELRAGLDAKRDGGDDRMAQIRDLLLGDHLKASELRYAALEGRIRDLEGCSIAGSMHWRRGSKSWPQVPTRTGARRSTTCHA